MPSPVRSNGMAMPPTTRSYFESRLGQDFSRVRVHTGEWAEISAAALRAKAFSFGSDVAFAAGRYQPSTSDGRELLAHELVHVAQQERGSGDTSQAEPRASAAAERVRQGESVSAQAQGGAPEGLYCDPDDDQKKPANAPAPSSTPGMPPLSHPTRPWFQTLLQPPELTPPSLSPLGTPAPFLPPYQLMSNADILAPFSMYGVSPSTAGFDIQHDWSMAFLTFRRYMPESLAVTSANTFLPAAYKATLGYDQPSLFDRSDLEFKAAFPNEWHIPPIPLVSSSTLNFLYGAISGKKNTSFGYLP